MKIILTLCFSLLILFNGCKKEDSTDPVTTNHPDESKNVLMPLKLGSSWTFDDIVYNQNGSINSKTIHTESLLSTIVVNNNTYYVSNWSDYKYINRDTGLFGVTDMGAFGVPNGQYSLETLVYKYPAQPNDSFENFDGTNTVLSISKSVTVPAGTFNGCYVITCPKGTNRVERCFKSNIGELYSKYIETLTGRVLSESVLTSYSL